MQLPLSFIQSLSGIPGFSPESFKAVHDSGEQVTAVRFNPFKKIRETGLPVAAPVPWCSNAFYLTERPSFTLDPLFHAGTYYVQDASSMFVEQVLQQVIPHPAQQKIIDLCAAPGGKTTLMASYFPEGLIVANEVIKSRANILVENTTKWGVPNIVVTSNDATHFQSLPEYFDVMLVDAPCSGSGLFRKDPSAIDEWSEENVHLCSQRQQRIVADALPCLKEDGILIYATCSYSQAEDEDIIDWLVKEMDMESVPVVLEESWGVVATRSSVHQAHGYRFFPDRLQGEGFFISVLRKKKPGAPQRYKETALGMPSKTESAIIQSFLPLTDRISLFKQAETVRAIPVDLISELKKLAQVLYIKQAGIAIGSVKGKDVIPDHALAMSVWPLEGFHSVELNKTDALQYLRCKDIPLPPKTGWHLVRYQHQPLGWIKVLPNRINNYYPREWRILKD